MARTGTTKDPIDEKRALLLKTLQSRGHDLANISRGLGRNHAYLHQYIFQGKPQYLPEAERVRLSEWTGLSEEQLGRRSVTFGDKEPPLKTTTFGRAKGERPQLRPYEGPELARNALKIPIYAAAQGGQGHIIITFDVIEELPPPADLVSVRGAYGILISGDSMVPAYRPGEIAWVHPHLPRLRDSDVVLYHVPPHAEAEAIIKTLVNWTQSDWKLRQYNPFREWAESQVDWPICHRIIGKRNIR